MDDDEVKTVNVNGVSAKEWEKARGIATRNGERMGDYINRSLAQLAEREAGDRFFPPERFKPPIEPDSLPSMPTLRPQPAIDLREIAAILLAMKEAGVPIQRRVQREINAAIMARLRGEKPHFPLLEGRD